MAVNNNSIFKYSYLTLNPFMVQINLTWLAHDLILGDIDAREGGFLCEDKTLSFQLINIP